MAQPKSQFKRKAQPTPANAGPLISLDQIGWVIYLIACAAVPGSYFFNEIVTEYYWGKALWGVTLFPLSILIAFVTVQKRKVLYWHRSHVIWPYLAFIGVCLLSFTWASNVWKSLERAIQVSGGFFALLGAMHYINSRRRVWQLLSVSLVTATIITFYGLMQFSEIFYLPRDQYKTADPSTTIGLTNFVVEYLVSMTPIFLIGGLAIARDWLRVLWFVGASIVMIYFGIADNRAGILGLLSGMGVIFIVMTWFIYKRNQIVGIPKSTFQKGLGFIFVALVAFLVATPPGQKIVERMESIGDFSISEEGHFNSTDASIRFRLQTWDMALRNMIPANLWVGVGLANIEVEFPRYYTEFLEKMTLRHNTRVVRAHNEYVQILTDLGLLGFIPFMLFLWGLVKTIAELSRIVRQRSDFVMFAGLGGGVAAFAVNAFFAFPLQVPSSSINFFVFVGLLDAVRRIIKKEVNPEDSDVKEIKLTGAAKMLMPTLIAVTVSGQAFAMNYAYHALSAEVRNKEARVFKRYKKWDETLALMHEAVRHNDNMEGYWYDRAVALMHFKRYPEALDNLLKTAELVPNYAMGRKQIAVLASQLGKTELAVNEYRATMAIFKTQRAELTRLASDLATKQGRPDLSIPLLEEAFEAGITTTELMTRYANALAVGKKTEEAVKVYEDLFNNRGVKSADLRGNYGTMLMKLERYPEAKESLHYATLGSSKNAPQLVQLRQGVSSDIRS